MGESWMGIWIVSFFGIFIISVAIYDYFDRKKRSQEIRLWKYLLAVIVGLLFMLPIVSGIALWLFRLPL